MRERFVATIPAATTVPAAQRPSLEPTAAILERVAVRIAVAATNHNRGWIAPGETRNRLGPYLHAPKPGHGIAGIRADIASGKLSMAALGQMKTREVMTRWNLSETQARRARAYVSRWGLGGQHRDQGGHARTQPGPSTKGRA